VELVSEIELAYRLRRPEVLLCAVTGTNGKTTVTTLLGEVFTKAGRDAVTAGNIGFPLIEAMRSGAEVVVAEVSSFQLQYCSQFRPRIGCWLNLAEDHLDWHPTPQHYAAAKARIWAAQGDGDTAVYNLDDARVLAAVGAVDAAVARVGFGGGGPGSYHHAAGYLRLPDGSPLVAVDELPRRFPHDISNYLAVAAVAVSAGVSAQSCAESLVNAEIPPHRVALVASGAGVDWYDDSKATTPASVVAAMAAFSSVVLIAGGRNKGLDLSVLGDCAPPVHSVVAIGEAGAEVVAAFEGRAVVRTAVDMASAVEAAAEMARPGDSVVLSPGCASFDWYRSYSQRGDYFAGLVRQKLGIEQGGSSC